MAAPAAAGIEETLRRVDVAGMVDRADDDVAARREGGDDDHESKISHGRIISVAEGRAITQEREDGERLTFAQPGRVSLHRVPYCACNPAQRPVDRAMDLPSPRSAPVLGPEPPQDRAPEPAARPAGDLAERIREARLRRLHAYWLERRGERRMPARRDIDPLDFTYLLGHIMLIDVIREPLRFRVRLHGTALVKLSAYELTGKLLDELPDTAYRAYAIERCRGLIESGEPAIVHHDRVLDGRRRNYEALWLPFSDDGSIVTMLLCALIHENRRERPRRSAIV
jgi:hypothetical protein